MADSRERIRGPSRDGREFLTSPRQVLRRLMLLSEGRQYREAAGVVGRLGPSVLRSVIAELPIDLLLDHLPHSAYLLESFFSRLITVNPSPKPDVPAEAVLWQLVKLFSHPHDPGLKQRCLNLLQSLVKYEPNMRHTIRETRKSFNDAVQGLGIHGLTTDQSGQLISLHVALKTELQRHVETYKVALHKLEELSMITINQDPAHSSHQRLLAISYGDIQQRLIDNKTLLTVLDKPALKQLTSLIENLSQRVENDKEVLKAVGQVKRVDVQANAEKRPAAGLLMNFARGCEVVLHMMGPENLNGSSANSVIGSPKSGSNSSCSDGYHSDDSANEEISGMVSQYRLLYFENRTDTLEALDSLPQLKHVHNLKAKILFSIIVLSFRLCHGMRERKVMEVRRTLNCPLDSTNEITLALDRSIRQHLHDTIDTFPLGEIERSVFNQVLSTLHEYPCLESCPPLTHYVSACVRLAWKMVNQKVPYYLDNDFNLGFLRPEKHERHTQADRRSDLIKAFLWPALMQNNHCVFKAIVLSFRLCHGMRERKVMEVRRTLNCPLDSTNEITLALDRSIRQHLHDTIDTFPLGEIERSVFNQVLSTLHEYPCLESCPPLTHYVSACVRLAWKMVNQKVPYYLDNDFNLGFLRPEKHERHTQADRRSDLIKAFLWPALMQNNHCVFKAIVVT